MKSVMKLLMVVGVFSMNYTVIKLMTPPLPLTRIATKASDISFTAFLYPLIPALFVAWLLRKHRKNNDDSKH